MEEGDAEGEGPMAVREGPSGHGLPANASSSSTTTTNLLASVKEQVGAEDAAVTPLFCVLYSLTSWSLNYSFTFYLVVQLHSH